MSAHRSAGTTRRRFVTVASVPIPPKRSRPLRLPLVVAQNDGKVAGAVIKLLWAALPRARPRRARYAPPPTGTGAGALRPIVGMDKAVGARPQRVRGTEDSIMRGEERHCRPYQCGRPRWWLRTVVGGAALVLLTPLGCSSTSASHGSSFHWPWTKHSPSVPAAPEGYGDRSRAPASNPDPFLPPVGDRSDPLPKRPKGNAQRDVDDRNEAHASRPNPQPITLVADKQTAPSLTVPAVPNRQQAPLRDDQLFPLDR